MSKVNYDLTKIKAIAFDVDGVLAPSTVPMSEDGIPMRMANTKDGYALQLAVKKGLKLAIITGADSVAVEKRFGALGIKDIFTKTSTKLPIFLKWMNDNNLNKDEVAYMGDDIPDLECMSICGLPVAPADAVPEIKDVAKFITTADGGYGAARQLVEEVLKANGLWLSKNDAFGW